MTAKQPRLYLDVDGVLNPYRSMGPHKHWPDYERVPMDSESGWSGRIWRSVLLASSLVAVTERHSIEIVWATSWAGEIEDTIVPAYKMPTGLRALPYVPDPDLANCGKLPAVRTDAGEDRPIVWIDDEHGPDDQRWSQERAGAALLIRPSPKHGLRPQDIDTIDSWADALTG